MSIYNKPVRLLMREMAAELAPSPEATFTRKQAVAWFQENYPLIKTGTVTAHLTRLSTNARSRTHYSAIPVEDDLFYQLDGNRFRLYQANTDPSPLHGIETTEGVSDDINPVYTDQPIMGGSEFAYEADLRDYLAKNLHLIEPGLRVYQDEGISGIEFPAGGRFIDILAVDREGNFVVIELKVSRGYDRTIGQLLRYKAWVKKNLTEAGQQVRGMIVAREFGEDLLLACSELPGVTLFSYHLSLSLERINAS